MQNQIILSSERGGWYATYRGPIRDSIMRLFATDKLQTAFGPQSDAGIVRSEIQRMNPDCFVIWA